MHTTALALMASVAMVSATDYNCPGPHGGIHAECEIEVSLDYPCANVSTEIISRMHGDSGWTDPHNGGNYTVETASPTEITGQRTTGKAPHYVDKFNIALAEDGEKKCKLTACSRSQTTSVLDYSTNYCDLHNLYCGSQFGCKYIMFNFEAQESFGTCKQHDETLCIV